MLANNLSRVLPGFFYGENKEEIGSEKGEIPNKCANLEIRIAENKNFYSLHVISFYRPDKGNDKKESPMKKIKPVLLALSMMLVAPLAVQAAEITLVPAVKLQIGDRDSRGNYWDGGNWRDHGWWGKHYEWRDHRWQPHGPRPQPHNNRYDHHHNDRHDDHRDDHRPGSNGHH